MVQSERPEAVRLDVRRVHHGDPLPGSLAGFDGVMTLGGPMAPDDDAQPWMAAELELLRAAHAAQLPLLGVCLGCQLLARAFGGAVGLLDGGIEAGFQKVTLSVVGREDPLFAGLPFAANQIHWHSYHVTTLPPGARSLASSSRTPHQAWSLGLRTWAIQYHPEAWGETLLAWADDEPEVLPAAGFTREELVRRIEQDDAEHDRLARWLFERVAMVLMGK